MLSLRAIAVTITICTWTVPIALAGPITSSTSYKYYSVRGDTPLEIIQSARRSMPWHNGSRAWATIDTDTKTTRTLSTGGLCKLQSLNVTMTHVITLPRHQAEAKLAPDIRQQYQSFLATLIRHEEEHRAISQSCNLKIRQRALALPGQPNCDVFLNRMAQIVEQERNACNRRHEALDDRDVPRTPSFALFQAALTQAQANYKRRPLQPVRASGSRSYDNGRGDAAAPVFQSEPTNR